MADGTLIEWTEATWNPLRGCSRASTGCSNCYAERVAARFDGPGQPYEGLIHPSTGGWNGTVRLVPEVLNQPIRWQRPRRIFVNSMSDLFHESVSDEWIDTIFGIMWACLYTRHEQPGHVFQILTKRPERMRDYLQQDRRRQWADAAVRHGGGIDPDGIFDQTMEVARRGPHPRIWLGVSVENQAAADERIALLLQTPAALRWLSCEPLLGPIDLTSVEWPRKGGHRVDVLRGGYWVAKGYPAWGPSAGLGANRGFFTNHSDMETIDWVVVGGESGSKSRPMHAYWARSLRDQCAADGANVPYFFKQWGEWAPAVAGMWFYMLDEGAPFAPRAAGKDTHDFGDGMGAVRLGKKRAGRLLDGQLHDAYPEVCNV
ncbi:DUF5131 family protein [Rhodanobacter sp. 115]|uniref:DUF5131 family protein n=1 Tax=Rhodanobacter sp. FW021-MT20 TaxID=1162282 RepID=UPI0034E3BE93